MTSTGRRSLTSGAAKDDGFRRGRSGAARFTAAVARCPGRRARLAPAGRGAAETSVEAHPMTPFFYTHVAQPIGTAPPGRKRRGAHRHLAPVRTRPPRPGSELDRVPGAIPGGGPPVRRVLRRQAPPVRPAARPRRHTLPAARVAGAARHSRTARPCRTASWPDGSNGPSAFRAVGAANGQNPLSIVIPCHRVIGSNGRLVGYGGGLPVKSALLALERRVSGGPARPARPRQGVLFG